MPGEDFENFKKNVSKLIGLDLFNYKNTQLERRIKFFMTRNNFSQLDIFYNELKTNKPLYEEFINMLTINVTEFFRNEDKFVELERDVLPMLVSKYGKNLKIWSAGCSSGAEIYSLAIILDKMGLLNTCQLHASDFDENILARAKKAEYTKFELSDKVIQAYRDYFTNGSEPDSYKLKPNITTKVSFKRQDLLNDRFDTNYHLILCRNVVIYFTEESKELLYKNFYNSLVDGGILFIGTTERINNHKKIGFNLISSFFYQK